MEKTDNFFYCIWFGELYLLIKPIKTDGIMIIHNIHLGKATDENLKKYNIREDDIKEVFY